MSINIERIELDVNIDQIEFRADIWGDRVNRTETEAAEYPSLYQAWVYNAKANEPDPVVAPIKGTRRPGDRASRRKATAHAKNRRRELATYSMDEIRPTGKVKDTGIRSYLKGDKVYSRNGKEICRKYSDSEDNELRRRWYTHETDLEKGYIDPDDYDQDFNPWGYTDEEFCFAGGKNLHGDYDHVATAMIYEDYHNPYLDDDDYEYYDYDPYQSAIDDRETANDTIADLRREIARYKDFLGEFNLTTLYQRWLADNNS